MSSPKNNPKPANLTPPNVSKQTKATVTKNIEKPGMFYFGKHNYYWMLGGLALIIFGLILMGGGRSSDPHVYDAKALFSFRRITLAPIMMVIGFALEVVAIMKKPKTEE